MLSGLESMGVLEDKTRFEMIEPKTTLRKILSSAQGSVLIDRVHMGYAQ